MEGLVGSQVLFSATTDVSFHGGAVMLEWDKIKKRCQNEYRDQFS